MTRPTRARSRRSRTALAVLIALVLGLDLFVVHGAHARHPVGVAEAWRSFDRAPTYAGPGGSAAVATGPRPVPGVYRYETTGSARLDRLGVVRRYPATTVRIIRHGPGCVWSETVPILREHVETYTACATDGDQLDTGFATNLTYFSVPGRGDSRCFPAGTRTGAGRRVGEVVRFRCVDAEHDVTTTGTATYDGIGSATVDGVRRSCRRVTVLTLMRGTTQGAAVRELCTEGETGLVLTETRSVGLTVRSRFVGTVRYVEEARFRLLSTRPQR